MIFLSVLFISFNYVFFVALEAWRLVLGAWCLKLAACGLFLPGTSRSSGRKREPGPAYRI